MTTPRTLTQSRAKRVIASALTDAQKRRDWSNADLGDALGCGEGTIRNRTDIDDTGKQMTVYELLRSVAADGTHIANAIFAEVQHQLRPTGCSSAPDAIAIAYEQTRCAAELIAASPGGYDLEEATRLLPMVVDQNARGALLEAELRRIIASPDTS
jgi:hypothetical protein